ncbi:MAG: hypothetical protein V2A76_14110 [Planctomycetota bacterium]
MVVKAAKRTTRKITRCSPAAGSKPAPGKKPAQAGPRSPARKKAGSGKTATKRPVPRKPVVKQPVAKQEAEPNDRPQMVVPRKVVYRSGRVAAPKVRLGMTPPEVRETTGQPECILFGSDDHVEWQFGARGFDAVGAPTLYVTALTFASGRVVRITERMSEALDG